jgi:hypothetical protein
VDVAELTRRQRVSLWLDGHSGLHGVDDALGFMHHVAIALRYGAASNLPLASVYRATQRQVAVPEVDRGPSSGPGPGVFYLSREGYPYRSFTASHPIIVSTALELSRQQAAADLLMLYRAAPDTRLCLEPAWPILNQHAG